MKSILRVIAIVLSVMLMTALSPAYAASFGRTTIGTIPSGGLRDDFKRGSQFVLSETGVMPSICAYLDTQGGGSGSQSLRFVLYRDQNGVPGEQVVSTESRSFGALSEPANWYCFPTFGGILEPGTYWIMIHTGDAAGVIRYYYDGPANWYGNVDEFDGGASGTFGTGASGAGTLSVRVDYEPGRFAGPTTVGTRVSSPMSALMKRGSSFVLTEAAQLWRMSAYIDGLGGTTGSQPLTIALYDDVDGEPSALVARANLGAPTSGSPARWITAHVEDGPIPLTPGRYWIVLSTGGPAGVLRYYMEGTGNWRGNTNPSEELPPFFGAAAAGNGTITANILYTAANVSSHTFGNTTPGNVTSGGLRANFLRGSGVSPGVQNGVLEGWVTTLWAYMDGNGGASGSQKVRLALYSDEPFFTNINLEVVSEEVTIPAGQPPGWVRFAVPRTRFSTDPAPWPDTYYIMMLSGDTAGVARYYASDAWDNWWGAPVDYAGGPPLLTYVGLGPDNQEGPGVLQSGTTILSVYAEYVKAE